MQIFPSEGYAGLHKVKFGSLLQTFFCFKKLQNVAYLREPAAGFSPIEGPVYFVKCTIVAFEEMRDS